LSVGPTTAVLVVMSRAGFMHSVTIRCPAAEFIGANPT
jgi:hypothetical protein